MRVATVLVMLTIASPAFADGAIVESCDWSAAGSCPFHATKGADYLIDLKLGTDCEATIQLVNPVGQVTESMFAPDYTDYCADSDDVGRAFRTEVGHLFRPKSAGRSDRCRPGWRVARRSVVISPWRCRSGQAAMAWAAFLRRESPRS